MHLSPTSKLGYLSFKGKTQNHALHNYDSPFIGIQCFHLPVFSHQYIIYTYTNYIPKMILRISPY